MPGEPPVRVRVHELAPDPDVFERTLALAVEVRDIATGAPPVGTVTVTAEGTTQPARATEAGVHLFVDVDLPEPPFSVSVATGERYFDREVEVTVADLAVTLPVTTATVVPTPAYDFPPTLTVVRGFLRTPAPATGSEPETVEDRAARGVEGAVLSVGPAPSTTVTDPLDYTVTTTSTGEFALPIPLGGAVETVTETFEETIEPEGGEGTPRTRQAYRRWVSIGGADPVLTVRYVDTAGSAPAERVATLDLHVEPQTTTVLPLELEGETVSVVSPTV